MFGSTRVADLNDANSDQKVGLMSQNGLYKQYLNARKTAGRVVRRFRARSHSRALIKNDCSVLSSVGSAIYETLCNSFSDEERKLIDSIESRRESLLRAEGDLEFIDYGAGAGNLSRTQDEMDVGVRSSASISHICSFSKPPFWASILFKLVRNLRPTKCVELGSCVGISGAYQSAALKLNNVGELISLEGSPDIANIASETFSKLELQEVASVTVGPFHQTAALIPKSGFWCYWGVFRVLSYFTTLLASIKLDGPFLWPPLQRF